MVLQHSHQCYSLIPFGGATPRWTGGIGTKPGQGTGVQNPMPHWGPPTARWKDLAPCNSPLSNKTRTSKCMPHVPQQDNSANSKPANNGGCKGPPISHRIKKTTLHARHSRINPPHLISPSIKLILLPKCAVTCGQGAELGSSSCPDTKLCTMCALHEWHSHTPTRLSHCSAWLHGVKNMGRRTWGGEQHLPTSLLLPAPTSAALLYPHPPLSSLPLLQEAPPPPPWEESYYHCTHTL